MSGAATGPLHGVPSAIKDLFDFKPGWPYTFGGVRAMKGCVAQEGIEPSTPTLARSSLTANIEKTSARRASCPHWRPLFR